jgi:hypothetical protein
VQLCTLPWLGFVPDDIWSVPQAAVLRLAIQLFSNAARPRHYLIITSVRPDGASASGCIAVQHPSAQFLTTNLIPVGDCRH